MPQSLAFYQYGIIQVVRYENMKYVKLLIAFFTFVLVSCSGGGGGNGDDGNIGGGGTSSDKLTLFGDAAGGHLNFTSKAASQTLSFEAGGSWQIKFIGQSEAASWCHVSATSGDAGTHSVNVSVDKNDTYDERNASIAITSGTVTRTVVVTQKPETALLLSSAKVEVDGKGGRFTIEVQANVKYTVSIAAQYAGWLKQVPADNTRGLTRSVVTFEANGNATGNFREGEIVFTSPEGVSETVHVYQKVDDTIVLSDNEIYVSSMAGTLQVNVSSYVDFDYSITSGGDWLHKADTRSMSTHTVCFSYDAYGNTQENRMATVEFRGVHGTTEVLTVYQTYKGAVVIDSKVMDISAAGGTMSIKYSANRVMDVRVPEWISIVNGMAGKTRSMELYELWVDIAPNMEKEARSGVIEFVDRSTGEVLDRVTVTQEELRFTCTSSLKDGDFTDARTHTFTIEVTTNGDCTVELPDVVTSLGDNKYQIKGNTSMSESTLCHVNVLVNGKNMKSYPIRRTSVQTPKIDVTDNTVSYQGGDVTVAVKCNSDMKCVVSASPQWLKYKGSNINKAGDYEYFIFNAIANELPAERSAVITFSTAGGRWTGKATVTQTANHTGVEAENKVSLTEPGSLASKMKEEELLTMEDLSLSGGINSSDMATIRKMATEGKLKVLDLSNATLKADGNVRTDNTIGDNAFAGTKLEVVKLPATVTKMGTGVFSGAAVKYVKLPAALTVMGGSCFNGCPNLSEMEFPATLKEIPYYTCINTPVFAKVTLHNGLEKIGEAAFARSFGENSQNMMTELTIPATVREIGNAAFVGTRIKTLTIPASVTSVGRTAFDYCTQLTDVVFEGTLTSLPRRIFCNCSSLKSIRFPKGLKVIEDEALYFTSILDLVIPEGVEEIGKSACERTGIRSITLPATLRKIGDNAFAWHGTMGTCKTIVLPAGVEEIGRRPFLGCEFTALDCRMTTPPALSAELFSSGFDYSKCTLYVPVGCADKYRKANYWNKFTNIIEK